jgi:outer membrane protein
MFKQAMIGLVAAAFVVPAVAQQEGNWMVRGRVLNMKPANKSDAFALGGSDAVHVSDKTFPEVDISYFVKPNIAFELVLTYPQKHDVTLNGVNLGTVKHLPPTLLAQYHFIPNGTIRPYLGAGINYTRFSGVSLSAGPGLPLDVSKNSWGGALQAGVDFQVAKQWFVNLDLKKVWIDTDVKLNGTKLTNLRIDPVLFSVGVGYRF